MFVEIEGKKGYSLLDSPKTLSRQAMVTKKAALFLTLKPVCRATVITEVKDI